MARRAALALALMIGFYLLAIGIAGALLALPIFLAELTEHLPAQIAIVCLVSGCAILWSIRPRFDRFTAPGPRLRREQHPRLFDEIESVAQATGQVMPAEVYLVGDLNAWVSQRGGVMGLGSRRIMGLGLPLMRTLTRSQMRAVIAHEFGHFHGGDTRLGPWIYKTRGAIFRTVTNLRSERTGWVQAPFRWYGTMFLRVTHGVSRSQELSADQLAARVAGARALIDGLKRIHALAPAFDLYWRNECQPVLGAGLLPPLTEGFAQFIRAPDIAALLQERVELEMRSRERSPFDTHPPLSERIAAVERLPQGILAAEDAAAFDLLDGAGRLDRELLVHVAGEKRVKELTDVSWDEVGPRFYLPHWIALVRANATLLAGVTPESLPALAREPQAFRSKVVTAEKDFPSPSFTPKLARGVIGAALAVQLANRGATIHTTMGMPVALKVGDDSFEPFQEFENLEKGQISAEDWCSRCEKLGIAGADLGRPETSA
jgi:heat shock protein HtpX